MRFQPWGSLCGEAPADAARVRARVVGSMALKTPPMKREMGSVELALESLFKKAWQQVAQRNHW